MTSSSSSLALGTAAWRDYETDGVPATGPHAPTKLELRAWAQALSSEIAAIIQLMSVEVIVSTVANLPTSADGTIAMVLFDTADNNGIYEHVSGAWVKQADLPLDAVAAQVSNYADTASAAATTATTAATGAETAEAGAQGYLASAEALVAAIPLIATSAPFGGTFDGTSTTITLPAAVTMRGQVLLFVGGVYQPATVGTVSGATLTLDETPPAGMTYGGFIVGSLPVPTLPAASQASPTEAAAGTSTVVWMSPNATTQLVNARLASDADAAAGTSTSKLMTPETVVTAINIIGNTTHNVRAYGALYAGSRSTNTAAINEAIVTAENAGGGEVLLADNYPTNGSIVFHQSGKVDVVGRGEGSGITPYHNGDTISINQSATSYAQQAVGLSLHNFWIEEGNKGGGYSINAKFVARFYSDIIVNQAYAGPIFENYNDLQLPMTIAHTRGIGYAALTLIGGRGGSGIQSDTAQLDRLKVSGPLTSGLDPANAVHGVIVDGQCDTVDFGKAYMPGVDGVAVWIRNTVGASSGPAFIDARGLEVDYPLQEAIRAEVGAVLNLYALMHGSRTTSNVTLFPGVERVHFKGGFSTGANLSGIDSHAINLSIQGMGIHSNSAPAQGGTAGAVAGLIIESDTRDATVTGSLLGLADTGTYQSYGAQINAGVDRFTVANNAGCNSYCNVNGGINNGAGTGSSKVVSGNV